MNKISKSKQAERHLINAGYKIRWNNFKGKSYPWVGLQDSSGNVGKETTDSTIIKLCNKLLPDAIIN